MSYSLTSIIAGLEPLMGVVGPFISGFSGDRFGKYRMGVVVLISVIVLRARLGDEIVFL